MFNVFFYKDNSKWRAYLDKCLTFLFVVSCFNRLVVTSLDGSFFQ